MFLVQINSEQSGRAGYDLYWEQGLDDGLVPQKDNMMCNALMTCAMVV